MNAFDAGPNTKVRRIRRQAGGTPAQEEMAQIKAELASAREREKEFRKEQLFLLQQMQGLKEALIRPQPLAQELQPIITER